MRVLTDFDGVLTNIAHEAARVTEIFLDGLSAADRDDDGPLPVVLATAYAEMQDDPANHGWRVNGRITAFANEDGFIRVNGIAAYLDGRVTAGDPDVRRIYSSLRYLGTQSFGALAQKAYEQMTRETAAGRIRPLDPEAGAVLKLLLDRGDEIVVVSNSGTERISQLLRGAGFDPKQDAPPGAGQLRIRGNARKYLLSNSPRQIEVGEYSVPVDRPHYEQILIEERPNVVVGDVFSLDLALPLDLVRRGAAGFGKPRLILRRRPYTPAWSASYVAKLGKAVTRCDVIDRIELIA
jgi:FMN phosphatase YigB (HAD superfamily)